MHQCSMVLNYINDHNEGKREPALMEQLENTLHPTLWTYDHCPHINVKYRMVLLKDTMRPRYTHKYIDKNL